ncbi:sensor histidine kinase [Nitriliruptor alkaliphilus]|uniref:sensor histidine kinase n=1 Tax=Nitriliruptor alkaliphilus TaxID=427918 RepID=UPI000698A651|nr:HAMP domain-containing sensor histidine kinase [Nitriliruptor alkaliphilus]
MTQARPDGADEVLTARVNFEETASSAAHEIAGPLGTVGAAVGLIAQMLGPDDDEARELVTLAGRHLRLIELQVRRIARLRPGPEEPQRRHTDLVSVTRELVDDLSVSLLADHATTVEAAGPVEAEVDADQVRQVLFNLLSNAAKYSPPDRAIVVSIAAAADAVELRVRDQGHGVIPAESERIFERYRRADEDVQGLGLGLTVSREIARAHGGDLHLEPAEEEGGSTFLLRLPLTG